jgi:hypothetical protein
MTLPIDKNCQLCGGTGKVIVRGSTDGHEWTYACHHNGTIAPINPWMTGGPSQGVQAGALTITYGQPSAMTALPSEPSDEMLERMIVAWFEDVNKTSVQKADC